MAKRLTAEQKRERWEEQDRIYKRTFLRDLSQLSTFAELWKLANSGRPRTGDPGDRYHHWLGCALHANPYGDAPADVQEAIDAALARMRAAAK